MTTKKQPEGRYATAVDVKEGDVLYVNGYRVRARNVRRLDGEPPARHPDAEPATRIREAPPVARYELDSAPNGDRPATLPKGYEGYTSGGNHLHAVFIESAAAGLPS